MFLSLVEDSQICTDEGKVPTQGVPSCETVREFSGKLKGLDLRHVIEGTEASEDRNPNQSGEHTRVQLGFCAKNKDDSKAAFLCIENRAKVYIKG